MVTSIANTSYWAGVFGPIAAGAHSYSVQVADAAGHDMSLDGTFDVLAGGLAVSDVVVGEVTPQRGIPGSGKELVLTWALTGADTITTLRG